MRGLLPVQFAAQALQLLALGLHEMWRRLGNEALVGELGLRAADLLLDALALGRGLARLGLAVDEVARTDLDAPARHGHGRGRLHLTLRARTALEVQARHPGHER